METFELSVEMIIGLRSFFCCLFGTSSRTNPRISSKSCLKFTKGITNYTCDTQFQINHQWTVLFLFGFFLIHTLNSIPPLWPNPSPWAHDFKKTWIYNTWEFFFEKLSFLIQKVFSLNSFLKVDHPIVAHSAPGEHDMNNFETTLLEDVSTDAFLAQWFLKEEKSQ